MESSIEAWETDLPLDNEPETITIDDEIVVNREGECPTSLTDDTSQRSENSLEIKMRDLMNLDTTGHDFVILQHSCVETGKREEEFNYSEEEPKMCNEKTATYWTGVGAENLNGENFPTFVDDTNLFVDETEPHLTVQMEPVQNNDKIYLPLKKTLRNLRLLDLKLKYNNQQLAHPVSECNNDSSSSSDESDSKFPEPREHNENPRGNDGETDNSYMINLLSQCQFKLEQMEELKHYCRKVTCSLWEAQGTIEYLKEKVAELHRENVQKEEDIFLLTGEVIKYRSLLCQKFEKATDVKARIIQTGDHGETRHTQQEFASIHKLNDQLAANTEPIEQNTSKICVIL